MLQHVPNVHTNTCVWRKKRKENQLSISCTVRRYRNREWVRGRGHSWPLTPPPFHPAVSLCFNFVQSICAGEWKLYKRKKRKGVHLCVYQVLSERGTAGLSEKFICVTLNGPQLFSNSDRRSSLLLLGRSGGSRYDNSSSGFASSGRSCEKITTKWQR